MQIGLWVAGSFLAGALVGGMIVIFVRRGRDAEKRMRRLQREYDLYQADVARHFTQTGELLSRLRGAFDQLYGEVEDRATELVGEDALQRRLRGVEGGAASPYATPRPPTIGDDRSGSPGFGGTADSAPSTEPASAAPEPGDTPADAEHVGDGPQRD